VDCLNVSIRAPAFRPGRPCKRLPWLDAFLVSIRAPAFRPGRRSRVGIFSAQKRFQSAPRPFDRGDVDLGGHAARVSMFQSAPRPFDRGDMRERTGAGVRNLVSIRAPAFRPGRQDEYQGAPVILKVSIRAPAFRPGRRNRSFSKRLQNGFQSAPRPFDRGDRNHLQSQRHFGRCFNPRPGLSTGATRSPSPMPS